MSYLKKLKLRWLGSLKECIDINNQSEYFLKYDLQFFAKEGEGGEKTEPATDKKLKEAREEGKVAKSQELTFSFSLIVLFLVLKFFISYLGEKMIGLIKTIYSGMAEFVDINNAGLSSHAVSAYFVNIIIQFFLIVLPFFIFGVAITVLVNIVQVGWKVSTKMLQPKFDKFNPINGFKRIFSSQSVFELVKSIVKIGLIALIAYFSIKGHANELFILYEIPLNQAIALVGTIIIDTGLRISLVYLVVGVADFVYQKHKFNEDMKMTKQEVKDEYKNTEGDPQIKGRQRARMREASQRRMMQDVPKADVVITNPTHIAVALKYDAEVSKAPVVLAKGEELIAQKIKDVAKENNISIVENKPLARMLYSNVDIGEEIPAELYQSVAEVLAAVYQANN